jgi:organic radical activating enzyme
MVLLPTGPDLDQIFPIVEIFHSIQGEGHHTGTSSVFIRFCRCNLRCPWCDTEFDEWDDMSLGQVIDEVSKFDCDRVILTGGEPALQVLPTLCGAGSPPVKMTLSQSNLLTSSMTCPSDMSSHSSNSVSHHGHLRLHRQNLMNTEDVPV